MTEILNRERRLYERLIETLEVEFTSNRQTYRGISGNFSLSGLFIRTRNLFAPGTIIAIIVHFTDGSTSKLTGRVTRNKTTTHRGVMAASAIPQEEGMGIEILIRDSHYLKFLRSFHTRPIEGERRNV
jgi:hypothetical protein